MPGGSGSPPTRRARMLDGDMAAVHPRQHRGRVHPLHVHQRLPDARRAQTRSTSTVPHAAEQQGDRRAEQIGRLTNLMQLTVDTSWWTRYRSRTQEPRPRRHVSARRSRVWRTASSRPSPAPTPTSRPTTTSRRSPTRPAFHFGTIEQGGTSLYPSLAQRVSTREVLRILLSIGPTETMHFQTWHDKAGNAPAADRPDQRAGLPGSQCAAVRRRGLPDQPDHARADGLPQPQVPAVLDHPPDRDQGRGHGRGEA